MKNLTEIVKYLESNYNFRRNEFTQNSKILRIKL